MDRHERYPSKFKNLWYRWVPGTEKISEIGYRWVLGTEEISKDWYRWVPGIEEILENFLGTDEYRVPARKKFLGTVGY